MVTLTELWLPILLSGVAVFFVSFLMWMVMPHHKGDWKKLPDEDALMDALRTQGAKGGTQYAFPHCASGASMKDPVWMAKFERGPKGFLIMRPDGPLSMGRSLVTSFLFNVVTAALVAYVATMAIPAGAEKAFVFRFVMTVAFLANSMGLVWGAIWFDRSWGSTLREMFDGAVYAAATAAVFVFFWPGVV